MQQPLTANNETIVPAFLSGGGEMGQRIRELAWPATPLGESDTWPQSLRIILNTLLSSRFPMFLFWGDEAICFYNDAYRPSLGKEGDGKHPWALGKPGKEVWPEIWDIIGPQIEQVMQTGNATWHENQLVPIYRNGKIEDVYWTYSYSPVINDKGRIEGVLVACTETTQAVAASQKAEDSRNALRRLLQQAPVAMCVLQGPRHVIELANSRQLQLWGRTAEEVLNRPVFDALPEAAGQGFEALLQKVLATGEPLTIKEMPARLLRQGRPEEVFLTFTYEALCDDRGQVTGIVSTAVDVTEQVTARKKVEEANRQLTFAATLTQNIADAVIGTDLHDTITAWNKGAEETYGYTEAEALGRPGRELLRTRFLTDEDERSWPAVRNETGHWSGEVVQHRKDGTPLNILVSLAYVKNEKGQPVGAVGVNKDITDRKKIAEAVKESEERFATTVNASALGLWDFDVLNRKVVAAGKMAEIYGLASNEEYTLALLFQSIHPDDVEGQQKLFADILAGKIDSSFDTEYRIQRKDTGAVRWIKAKGSAFFNSEGVLYRTVGTVADITGQKNADERIKESKERLQAALRASLTGTFRWNIQTNELSWDENLDRLFGLPPGLTVQNLEKFIERVHPDDRQGVIEACRRCAEEGADFDQEFRVVWPDGSLRWLDDKGKTFFDEQGSPHYITGACVDITAHKLAHEKLQESEERFRTTFENAAVGVAHVGLNGSWLFINNRISEILGYSKEELQQRTFQDVTHPDDLQTDLDYVQQLLAGNILTYSMEKRYIRKDGSVLWANLTVSLMRDEAGQPRHFVSIVQDISARKKTEEALAYQKTLLETVTENTDMALFLMDDRQYCVYMNEAAEQMTGFTLDELKGKQLHYHIHHSHPDGSPFPLEECPIDQALPTKKRMKGEEVFVHRDGSFYPVAFTASPILVEGKAIGTVIEVRNTTEEKKKEQALRESEELFRSFSNNIQNLAWIADGEGWIYWYNQRWYDYTGTNLADMQGWGWEKVHHPDHIEWVISFVKEAWKKDEPWELTFPLQGADGNYRWFLTRAVPVKNEKGKIYRWIGTNTNIHEQKLAEDAIKEREQRFRTLTQSLPQLIWTANADGYCDFFNQNWYDYTGSTPEQSYGDGWAQYIHPDNRQPLYAAWQRSLNTTEPIVHEFQCRAKDGRYEWFYVVGNALKDDKGNVLKWIGTLTNIDERKKAEMLLQESEERFRIIADVTPNMVWSIHPNGSTRYVNQYTLHYFGYTEETFPSDWSHIIHPSDLPGVQAVMQEAFGQSKGYRAEFRLKRHDGAYRHFVASGAPAFLSDGSLYGYIGTTVDITDIKEAQQKLIESESRFRTLAETLPQLIWVANAKGENEYYNRQWLNYAGIDDPYKAWDEMIHPEDKAPSTAAFEKACASGEAFRCEVRLRNKAGEYRWHNSLADPVKDDGGNVVKWIGAITDIHDPKTLTEKLEKLVADRTAALQRSNEDLQQFAHVASHDLKEPVRKVMTFANRISGEFEETLPEKAKFYLSKIVSAASRSYAMIDGVLLYSSLNAAEMVAEPIDLNNLLRNIETDLEILIAQRGAAIEYENLPAVKGSAILLYQLFYNLVNNSLKFVKADRKPVIQIASRKLPEAEAAAGGLHGGRYVEIRLTDNGIGFSQRDAERIFQTFFRLNPKDKFEGTGLGLALCKKIVERHGGSIRAEGREDEGASFVMVLPTR